jgi:DNA gyrase/topoisomerase IV subunit A
MKNVVTNLYPEYLRYIDSFRAIPWKIDALKPVERRLLLTVHEVARTKLQKSAKVVGFCLGKWHPHGDIACYEALAGLVNRGLVTGQGNWGSMGLEDMSCAAQRYCLIGQTPISTNFGSIEIEKLKLAKELNLKLNCLSYNQTVNSVSNFLIVGSIL